MVDISANIGAITGTSADVATQGAAAANSYSESSAEGRAANAGETVGNLLNGGTEGIAVNNDISYSSMDDEGNLDANAALAYADQVVTSVDSANNGGNGDSGITLGSEEQQKVETGLGIENIEIADVDSDGLISRAEVAGLIILQDCQGDGADGIASAQEAAELNIYLANEADEAITNLEALQEYLAPLDAKFEKTPTKLENAQQQADKALKAAEEAKELAEKNAELAEKQQEEIKKQQEELKKQEEKIAANAATQAEMQKQLADIQAKQARMQDLMELASLAQSLGLSLDVIAKIADLEAGALTLDKISQIAQLLGISPEEATKIINMELTDEDRNILGIKTDKPANTLNAASLFGGFGSLTTNGFLKQAYIPQQLVA
ncbi:MAG TPA: hypothetical protein P5556_09280 [Candidatus Gastranaerophilales bacterium]|nr:hypothetical protein [Candidatus Gastranaerophilales bacterium]